MSRKLLVSAAAATLMFGIAACGDDDDAGGADTTAPATDAPATTHPADHTTAATGDVAAFCETEIEVESAVLAEDPAALEPAFEALGAGPAVITLENLGEEFHEIALMRVNDDVTETLDELLALPEAEVESKVQDVAGAFAAPGATGYTAAELAPGRYVALCFIPAGLTPEAMAEMEVSGAEPEGQPHAMLGMVHEFQVA